MFIASTALTGNAPQSGILDACALVGVIGGLLAGTAGSLYTSGAHIGAMRMLLLSYACAVTGAICMIAGTQSRTATLLTALCIVAMVGVVARSTRMRVRTAVVDAEAGMPDSYAR